MQIRRIQPADAMAVKRLRVQALTLEPLAFAMDVTQAADWSDDQWAQMASRNSAGVQTIVIAHVADELVGMVGCHRDASPTMAQNGPLWDGMGHVCGTRTAQSRDCTPIVAGSD